MKPTSTRAKDSHLDSILELMTARHGVEFSLYRRSTVERRIAKRMASIGYAEHRDYLPFLLNNPEECNLLLRELTLKVSRFFRNRPLFDLLTHNIFPSILRKKEALKDRSLRIWCAGCACGEEAYSIAISLAECLRDKEFAARGPHISIFGTDIDENALEKAAAAVYKADALREVRPEILERYFIPLETKSGEPTGLKRAAKPHFKLVDSIRDMVHFSRHDLASDSRRSPPAGVVANYDMVLCRNLLIYFSRPLQEKAFLNLYDSLDFGGYLILGKSEGIPENRQRFLAVVSAPMKVYRRSIPTDRDVFC